MAVMPTETMKWHCVDCKANFQWPKNELPANGCEKCGSKRIFDCNVEFLGRVVPHPAVTSHEKCDMCGQEMRHHFYIEEINQAVCPDSLQIITEV